MEAGMDKSRRTSKAQILWILSLFGLFFKKIFGHVKRFSAVYAFLVGVISTIFVLAAVLWYGVLAYPLPWKVIDPADPRFEPMKFEFADYDNSRDLQKVLNAMFPVGTAKSDVDLILGGMAGARIKTAERRPASPDDPEDVRYYYDYENTRSRLYTALIPAPGASFSWTVTAIYSRDGKLKRINAI